MHFLQVGPGKIPPKIHSQQFETRPLSSAKLKHDERLWKKSFFDILNISMWAKKQSGFTIVELLIVIVVIAILAAITIVSYNGIQNSSRSAKMLAAIDAYTKAAHMYKAINGRFPNPNPGAVVFNCLGIYPAQGVFGINSCVNSGGTDGVLSNTTLNSQFQSIMGTLPNISDVAVKVGSVNTRGIEYSVTDEDTGHSFIYYVSGLNQKCGRGQATNIPTDNATECKVYLN